MRGSLWVGVFYVLLSQNFKNVILSLSALLSNQTASNVAAVLEKHFFQIPSFDVLVENNQTQSYFTLYGQSRDNWQSWRAFLFWFIRPYTKTNSKLYQSSYLCALFFLALFCDKSFLFWWIVLTAQWSNVLRMLYFFILITELYVSGKVGSQFNVQAVYRDIF